MTVQSRRQRSTPFLQRNILQAMGNSQSTAQKAAAPGDLQNDNDDRRATKRPRLHSHKNPPHTLVDQLFHAHEVSEVQHNLSVSVTKLFHKDSKRISAAACDDYIRIDARCKIILTHGNHQIQLYCNSQLCEIKSFKDPGGPLRIARVCLKEPFYIPKHCMRVNHEDDYSFDLANDYRLVVELEAAGPTHWPPIVLNPSTEELGSSRKVDPHRWVLQAAMFNLFSKEPAVLNLKVKKSPTTLAATDHCLEVDVRWTTAFEARAIRELEDGVKPSITVLPEVNGNESSVNPPQFDSPPGTPSKDPKSNFTTPVKASKNGLVNGEAPDDDDSLEKLTPNRSLRTRGPTKNYNVKDMSDKALGREGKRKKRRNTHVMEDKSVTYKLPAEKVSLDSYRCVTCGLLNGSLLQLKGHFITQHAEYDYAVQTNSRGGVVISVTHRYESYTFGAGSGFSVSRPTKIFKLDEFADGNTSQLDSRFGPEDESITEIQPRDRQQAARLPPPQTRSKLLIPDIKQKLYDPISRAIIEPGTEYKAPQPNDEWLIQWHRDALADFSDVPPEEREYMQQWDRFMLTKRISSNIYFPRAWLNFVKLNANWLLSKLSRNVEFGKHLTYLLARNSLDHATVQEGLDHLNSCREKLKLQNGNNSLPAPEDSPRGPHVRKSASGCQVCGLTVLGPRLLLCSRVECTKRLYHSDCISEKAIRSVEDPDWLCNECIPQHEKPA
ncbi:hypothetical protein CkaCkLH20_04037 [Colletotrichum karsti]|uniref:Zinc finger PHD-type domain-containing protein n=1 Tax=Colletotrichum karsti TaxID=1095194 RepID=A0A9P6IGR7_9PEZI|nr:uncharacterized protein CkaCkLH20_04037 [Colletotrichum karsti]KAF9878545.1 hypothetical protein CkaCkLH20_04037 [Colletotrichum karsti]